MQSLKAAFALFTSPVTAAIVVVLVLLAATAGPFGTYTTLTLFERLVFFGTVLVAGFLFGSLVRAIVDTHFPASITTLWAGFIVAPLQAIVITPVELFLAGTVLRGAPAPLPDAIVVALYVLLISLAVHWVRYWLYRQGFVGALPSAPTAEADPPAPARPYIYKRLPEDETGEILRLTAEDHFVNVVTRSGQHKVRMRMSDAVLEMDGTPGYTAHRSHWVARDAIETVEREKGREVLVLTDGSRVPVGRTYRPQLVDAGLI